MIHEGFSRFSLIIFTQRKENLYIKGTSLITINERTFGYGQTNVR